MKWLEDLKKSIKKDKKKLIILLLPLLLIIGGVILSVQNSGDDTITSNIAQTKQKTDAIPMPGLFDSTEVANDKINAYDLTNSMNKKDSMSRNQYNLSDDEFFGGTIKSQTDLEKNQHKTAVNDLFNNSSNHSGNTSSNAQHSNYTKTKAKPEIVYVDNTPKKRRRIPTDSGTMGGTSSSDKSSSRTIKAVVSNGNKPVKSGSTIRVRLAENCVINGVSIPKNTVISGICSFGSERVNIKITSIKYNGQYLPTSLLAYENDGIKGVYIPGGIQSEIVKDGADEVVSTGGTKINTPIGTFGVGSIKKGLDDPTVLIRDGHLIVLKFKKK